MNCKLYFFSLQKAETEGHRERERGRGIKREIGRERGKKGEREIRMSHDIHII